MDKCQAVNGMSPYHSAMIACILFTYGIWFWCENGQCVKMLFGRGHAVDRVLRPHYYCMHHYLKGIQCVGKTHPECLV